MKLSFSTFITTAIFCSGVNAANWYVNATGSGLNCSEADPCPTIQMAVDNSSAGDTILVAKGTYVENIKLGSPASPMTNPGITITGAGKDKTIVVSAGISSQRPAGILADIVFDIWSADVTIEKLSIVHPEGAPVGRDIGVFVSPHGNNFTLRKSNIIRKRTGDDLEPSKPAGPGSRGVLVFRALDTVISKNTFSGNYEDHIHMPTSNSEIIKNKVVGATRLGIVIIQEEGDFDSIGNIIAKNKVSGSGNDGIQIQGDDNIVSKNKLVNNAGVDIKLCGISEVGDCVTPFDAWSEASDNIVSNNKAETIVDNGTGNIVTLKSHD